MSVAETTVAPIAFDTEAMPFTVTRETAKLMTDARERERYLRAFGEDFHSKRLSRRPGLRLTLGQVVPGQVAPPHRHGSCQVTYVLSGGLRYGARMAGPGMGYYNPNRLYSWVAGPEGAVFLEAHDREDNHLIFPEDDSRERRSAEQAGQGLTPFLYDAAEAPAICDGEGVSRRDLLTSSGLTLSRLDLEAGAFLGALAEEGPITFVTDGALHADGQEARWGVGVATGQGAPDWRAGPDGASVLVFASGRASA